MSEKRQFEVYFDFDNTITSFDVLDDIIQKYSINTDWKQSEEDWQNGKIGSKECLERQLANIRVSWEELTEYLHSVTVDAAFPAILELLRFHSAPAVIVSDSFTPFICQILEANAVYNIEVLANDLKWHNDKPILSFPYYNTICSKAANCKTSHLFKRNRAPGTAKIYIGDGKSDICPAQFCEILFAKGTLYQHYKNTRDNCFEFADLSSVYNHLLTLL